jgi:hypothetical protein
MSLHQRTLSDRVPHMVTSTMGSGKFQKEKLTEKKKKEHE